MPPIRRAVESHGCGFAGQRSLPRSRVELAPCLPLDRGVPNYDKQRTRKVPPHISLGDLRSISGKTLEQVCALVADELGKPFTRGALSAIENGHRGASAPVLAALEVAYGLRPGALSTTYVPRNREDVAA